MGSTLKKEKILITGGKGLIGTLLTILLRNEDYDICFLSRTKKTNEKKTYLWNPELDQIEIAAFSNVSYIIHLAGANISDGRWTKKRKQEILNSRTKSINLLYHTIQKNNFPIKAIVVASAIGYYGTDISNSVFTENDNAGSDFLATTCSALEIATKQFDTLQIRTVILRTGVVLTRKGGALAKMIVPIKYGLGAFLGTGNQYFPWIHIDDLCQIYLKTLQDKTFNGIYNAVAPTHTTNKELTIAIAKHLKKYLWLPAIPAFVLKIIFGEMAQILLFGNRTSSDKLIENGFTFEYNTIENALKNLIK